MTAASIGAFGVADGGHRGKSFLNHEHAIADAGRYRVERNDGIAERFFVDRQRLNQQDLLALVGLVLLLRGDDVVR